MTALRNEVRQATMAINAARENSRGEACDVNAVVAHFSTRLYWR